MFSAVGVLPGCPRKKTKTGKKCGLVKSYKVGLAAAAAAAVGWISLLAADADYFKLPMQDLQKHDFKILNSACSFKGLLQIVTLRPAAA